MRLAREAGALVSFDVNFRPSLWEQPEHAVSVIKQMLPQVDLVKVNEAELDAAVRDGGAAHGKRADPETRSCSMRGNVGR